jgi:hypothetical protein
MSEALRRLSLWIVLTFFASFCVLAVYSQEGAPEMKQDKAEHKTAHSATSVTGCLEKGNEPGGFYIKGDDGKTWELMSKKVKLADHVGHQVTVKGWPGHGSPQKEQKAGASEKQEAGGNEHADLRVKSLKMVSDSCNK